MAPPVASAKITLSCPLFAADFDPRNHGLLLVGGGGGEGRSGVGNKIALLNTSKPREISELVDIQLSRDEDSVTCLAIAESGDDSMIALAGINSSQAEQLKGNNQHLRSFRLEYPPRKRETQDDTAAITTEKNGVDDSNASNRKTTPLSQISLFSANAVEKGQKPASKVDTYQRLIRISPYEGSDVPRIGAIATGLAPAGEIVIFNATSQPQASDVMGRIRLGNGEEAEDIDIIGLEAGNFLVSYTNGLEVFTFEISSSRRSNTAPEVQSVFTIPKSLPKRSRYRALRFLSPTALLLLQNTVDRTGCEISVLSLPSSREGNGNGSIIRQKRLRKSIKIGLSLDVINLGQGESKERQFFIALAGSDQSIETLTLDYAPTTGYSAPQVYTTLTDVHPFSMTKVCFSHYRPPSYPVTGKTPPQYVKLASISLGNTVVVHTFPLLPQRTAQGRETQSPRYALKASGRSETWETMFSVAVALLVVAFSCFVLQAFTEIRGVTPAYLGAVDWLPHGVRNAIARPYNHGASSRTDVLTTDIPRMEVLSPSTTSIGVTAPSIITGHHLRELLEARMESHNLHSGASSVIDSIVSDIETPTPSPSTPTRPLILRHDPEQGSIYAQHDDHSSSSATENNDQVRKWEDLLPEQREKWRHHLSQAGHWALEEGEHVLRGIFFGEIGGVLAAAVGGG